VTCELSDLPVDQCACRIHGSKAEPARLSPIVARYPGLCLECRVEIEPGDPIVAGQAGRYVHEDCS
jgi:hypothetical protein